MKRRTLDFIFSAGGLALAGLLLIVGLVMTANANFSKDYVRDQLRAQQITFKEVDKLTPEEAKSASLVKYAGQRLETGKQAEAYANDFIGLHVANTAKGETYATLGDVQTSLKAQIAAAQTNNDPNLANLNAQLATVTAQRETLFKGETLRGLLLTSYGFSELGNKADQAATVAYVGAALLFALSIAGFVHAFRTAENVSFAPVESSPAPKSPKPVTI